MNCSMKMGDLLSRDKGFVKHKGVFLKNDKIIHNSPSNGVEIVTYEEFSAGKVVRVVKAKNCDKSELAKRLYEVLNGGNSYHLTLNNCEHVANYLVYGRKHSPQIQASIIGLLVGYLVSHKNNTANLVTMRPLHEGLIF